MIDAMRIPFPVPALWASIRLRSLGLALLACIGVLTARSAPPLLSGPRTNSATVGSPVSIQLTASNSPTLYTASGLPPGLTLDPRTGLITGTPRSAGSYTVRVAAANADGTSFESSGAGHSNNQFIYFTVNPASTPDGSPMPAPRLADWSPFVRLPLGTPFTREIVAEHIDPSTRRILLGELPPGLALVGNRIEGVPTQSGLYFAEVAITNAAGHKNLPIVFHIPMDAAPAPAPTLSTPAPFDTAPGELIELTIAAEGEVLEFSAGPLPVGLHLDRGGGRIYGRPVTPGAAHIVITARGPTGWAEPVVWTVNVSDVPTLDTVSINPSTWVRGVSSAAASVSPNPGTGTTRSISGLPVGLAPSGSGISGTPSEAGFFTPLITLTNHAGSASRTAPLVVLNRDLEPMSGDHAPFAAIAHGSGRFVRVGYGGAIASSDDLGVSWTPRASGVTTTLSKVAFGADRFVAVGNGFVITSADGITWSAPVNLPATGDPLAVAVGERGIIILGSTRVFTSSDGQTWTNYPSYLVMSGAVGVGFFEGDYAVYGTSETIINRSGDGLQWTGPLTLPTNIYADLGIGRAGSQFLRRGFNVALQSSRDSLVWTARGTSSDLTYVNDFAHGGGVTLLVARLHSTPLLLRNLGPWAGDVVQPADQAAIRGQPFTLALAASESPTAFFAHGLPDGLSLDPATGLISGAPGRPGIYGITVASANALGPSRPKHFMLRVSDHAAPPPAVAGAFFVGGEVGRPLSYDPRVQAGAPPIYDVAPAVAYTINGAPPGLALDPQNGVLSGTPSAPGTYTTDYTLTGPFPETRHRVTTRIAPAQWHTTSLGDGSSSASEVWSANDRFALQLSPGQMLFSENGREWTPPARIAPAAAAFTGFAHGAGRYVLSTSGAVYVSADLSEWTRHELPRTEAVHSLLFAASRFLLLGGTGASSFVLSSADGQTWAEHPLGLDYRFWPRSLAYGNGRFVCTLGYGNIVLTSADGETWAAHPTPQPVNGLIAFNSGRFVVATAGGAISTDGIVWRITPATADSPYSVRDLRPIGRGFVAIAEGSKLFASLTGDHWWLVAQYPLNSISSEGLAATAAGLVWRHRTGYPVHAAFAPARWLLPEEGSWSVNALAGAPLSLRLDSLVPRDGLVWRADGLPAGLAIGASGDITGSTSVLGVTRAQVWAEDESGIYPPVIVEIDVRPTLGVAPRLHGLAHLPDATFAADYTHRLPLEFDGLDETSAVEGLPPGLAYDPSTRTIGGRPSAPGTFDLRITAQDSYGAREWTRPLRVLNGELTSVATGFSRAFAWNGHTFLSVGALPSGLVYGSTDGVNWTLRLESRYDDPIGPLNGVHWAAGLFVVVGDNGAIFTSPDGLAWTRAPAPTTQHLRAVAHNGTRWVAVGAGGVAVTSLDGLSWQAGSTGSTATFNGIVHDGAHFIATGSGGAIRRSADGSTWTAVTSGVTTTLYAVAHGGRRYVVGTTNRNLLVSTDGVVWSTLPLPFASKSSSNTRGVAYFEGLGFVACFYDDDIGRTRLLRSSDGLAWKTLAGYSGNSQAIAAGGGRILVADGSQGRIRVFPADAAPQFESMPISFAFPGVPFHHDLAPWGLATPVTATGLPPGLVCDPATGTISGTTWQEGVYSVAIRSAGDPAARLSLTLGVLAGRPGFLAPAANTYRLSWFRGEPVDWPVPTVRPATSWRSAPGSPPLPPGLTLDTNTGRIRGTPTGSGVFLHQFYASNLLGESFGSLSITILDRPPLIRRQPASLSVDRNKDARFSVETSLGASARFQWYRDGVALTDGARITGTRSPVLKIGGALEIDAATYSVVVSDGHLSALSQAASLTVQAPADGYDAWATQYASALGDTAPAASPFGDGVANLLRYALGLPLSPVSSSDYLQLSRRGDELVLLYVRPASRPDLVFRPEASTDLQTWSAAGLRHSRVPGGTDSVWETWEAAHQIADDSPIFIRLRVETGSP